MEMTIEKLRAYLVAARQFASPTVVTGHAAPDTDAAISALMEAWRRYETAGEETLPVMRCERLPSEVARLCGDLAPLLPLGDTAALGDPTLAVVLTDTHDTADVAGRVTAVVDHHIPSTPPVGVDADIQRVGATATIVATRFMDEGLIPDDTVARLLLGGIWMDTDGLSAHKATPADHAASAWLAAYSTVSPAALYEQLQKALLDERDVMTLYRRDYRIYRDADGAPFVCFAVLKVRQDALPDLEAVRRLLAADVAARGVRVAVAKIILYAADWREEYYLAAGEAAETLLARVRETAGAAAVTVAEDAVYLPPNSVHRGRKFYAQHFHEWLR